MKARNTKLEQIIDHLQAGLVVEKAAIIYLLGLSQPKDIQSLFMAARKTRARNFGNQVFFYGFLYFSTFCRNNCRFCQYRRDNTILPRYRKSRQEILMAAREIAGTGVHLIDLTMGEDPKLYAGGIPAFQELADTARAVREETGLPVMISPGALPDEGLQAMARAGVEWYACYQETHTRSLYEYLRLDQDFDIRMAKKKMAGKLGMFIEEGLLTGAGESLDNLAESICRMKAMEVDQARVMTFVPQLGTPMSHLPFQDDLQERIIIAVLRLVLPDRLIPASLDVGGLDGLEGRLDAGANVVTSIVPPKRGLAGVANNSLDIEDSRRTLGRIIPILENCGLEPAPVSEFQDWMDRRRLQTRAFKKETVSCE